ncbi:Norsolorinic acid ketoreductase [Lachnellula suecica]|uniref:Norsolorinic acid ketoreductase n=1 Tax=Lachnellula suecica TaxID=602035 RepID=A0A8T9CRV9_9HELO|nr:Norsolorinic acid ketoreductase [Lachnellula suecica]
MSPQTNLLIHGANRGLGQALTAHYLLQPYTFIAAAVRDPSHSTSQSLLSLPKGHGSAIVLLKLDSLVEKDFNSAVEILKTEHGIKALDLVISSAGIAKIARIDELDIGELKEHVEVNALGPVRLFQAMLPLLKKAKHPKFFVIGSMAGSVGQMSMYPYPNASYSSSKAMLNSLVRKIQMENPWLVALTLHPGWAQTDMGNEGAKAVGLGKAAVTVDDSISGVLAIVSLICDLGTEKWMLMMDFEA